MAALRCTESVGVVALFLGSYNLVVDGVARKAFWGDEISWRCWTRTLLWYW